MTAALAGCLSNGLSGTEYEQCPNTAVKVEWLPESVKSEVNAAIKDGEYTTSDDLLLAEVIDVEKAFLIDSGGDVSDYYKVYITETGDETRLELEEVVPKAEAPELVAPSEYQTDLNNFTIDVHIEYKFTNEVLFDETVELERGESTSLNGDRDYRWGDYRAKITTKVDGEEFTQEEHWSVTSKQSTQTIRVENEGVGYTDMIDENEKDFARKSICEWDDDGELIIRE